jgi:DNA polymerase-1
MVDTKPVLLLIDGDTLAFRAAAVSQHTIEHPSGYIEHFARRGEGEAILDNIIARLRTRLKADKMVFFLSCPGHENWRLKVADTYKSNRKDSVRPMLLDPLKDYLRLEYGANHTAFLEADDILGITATDPEAYADYRKIVVGRDKDFATIPGEHYQLLDDTEAGDPIIRTRTAMEAAKAHYVQALTGDAVDGYEGCPGIGKVRALRIVEEPERLVPKKGVITRGKNKGQEVTKWHSAGPCSIWEAVVSNYEKAGLTEAHALKAARLARILLHGEYDFDTHTVRLWVPGDE